VHYRSGHIHRRRRTDKPRRKWSWSCDYLNEDDAETVRAWNRSRGGGAEEFTIENGHSKLARPYDAMDTSTAAGGTIGARTYYVAYAWSDGTQVTNLSEETSQAINANNLMSASGETFPANVTEARVYIGTSSGTLYFAGTISSSGGTWTEPYTTVNVNSNQGQKVLNVASTTNFEDGQVIIIGEGTARQESGVIDSVGAGTLTLEDDLTYNHTALDADKVYLDAANAGTLGTAAPTSNNFTETVTVVLEDGFEMEPVLIAQTGKFALSLQVVEHF